MAGIDFHAPNFRAGGSDLTINISPLGLVELSDEEFEVHGPRLQRYQHAWAFYLGHHWSYRREVGEPQITVNYCRAISDYITNFTFGNGFRVKTPLATEAIVPGLLQRVWEVDNHKAQVLWEMGNQGSVAGDVFVKIAYEEPFKDALGRWHPGRVRILPLHAGHCFPEWHPHDRSRLTRFKLKYRFWGTTPEGTRQVFTYTEIITDDEIREYVNDELLPDSPRPNPLGVIPVVHIADRLTSGSPWGLGDLTDLTPLNREFNEKMTDISDIINYHAEPVTIITGAKASQLEKGSKKMWAGLPADANVFNLELGGNLAAPLAYLEILKRQMHEVSGVPETALGQSQPISNTSVVALQIQFGPLMNVFNRKKIQYGKGIERINEIAILTLAIKEPEVLQFNPGTEANLKAGQYPMLDPMDPLTYRNEVEFPSPLPLDVLVKLNEVQGRMGLGLESRRGALRELGEEFPDEKIEEIMSERIEDAKEDGALQLLQAHIQAAIMTQTGFMPVEGGGFEDPMAGQTDEAGNPMSENAGPAGRPPTLDAGMNPLEAIGNLAAELNIEAYGTKLAQRRNPTTDKTP